MVAPLALLLAGALAGAPAAAQDHAHERGDWSVGVRGGITSGASANLHVLESASVDLTAGVQIVPGLAEVGPGFRGDFLYQPPMLGYGKKRVWGWHAGVSGALVAVPTGLIPGLGAVVGLNATRTHGLPLELTVDWRPLVHLTYGVGVTGLAGFGATLRWSFQRPTARTVPYATPPRL